MTEACPKCDSAAQLRSKWLLIDAHDPARAQRHPHTRGACACEGDLGVDGLKPELVADAPLQQFVSGLYCEACGIGFVPETMAKPAPQRWVLTPEGYRVVRADGTLGPAQPRMGG